MSAPACICFFGLRFSVREAEVEGLEHRTDARLLLARSLKLQTYWGDLKGGSPEAVLFVGKNLGIFGPEGSLVLEFSLEQLIADCEFVRSRLSDFDSAQEPRLHIQWIADE